MQRMIFISILFFIACRKEDVPTATKLSINGKWKFITTSLTAVSKKNAIGPFTLNYQENEFLSINSDTSWSYHRHNFNIGTGPFVDTTVLDYFFFGYYGNAIIDKTQSLKKISDTTFVLKPNDADTFYIRKLSKSNLVISSKTKFSTIINLHTIDSLATF